MNKMSLIILRIYKYTLSPFVESMLGNGCRFTPTCSNYAHLAIKKFGIIRGVALTLKRLIRCHPFSRGLYDPVPTQC